MNKAVLKEKVTELFTKKIVDRIIENSRLKKTIVFILCILFSNFGFSQENCEQAKNGKLSTENTLARDMCRKGYVHWSSSSPIKGFEKSILRYLGYPEDDPEKEKHISAFFNQYNACLICDDSADIYIRENEHILKRSLALGEYNFVYYAAKSNKYKLDWNFYEIVEGEKETIIDYIEKIINDEELASDYNVLELKTLVSYIENSGGKRGKKLK